jgi:dihydrofolate reductase
VTFRSSDESDRLAPSPLRRSDRDIRGDDQQEETRVGTIKVHEFVSLDGVFEDPRWTAEFGFPEGMGQAIASFTSTSSAILLGRRTFEMFAPAWSTRSVDDDPGVPFFNDTPKYVVSSSLASADAWQNSSILGGYDAQAIGELKQDGDIYISGSGTLVRALLGDGLIDELHLLVYPVVLGAGARLFPDGARRTSLTLTANDAFENGVLHLTYGPAAR